MLVAFLFPYSFKAYDSFKEKKLFEGYNAVKKIIVAIKNVLFRIKAL